jgi:hypothetical protein
MLQQTGSLMSPSCQCDQIQVSFKFLLTLLPIPITFFTLATFASPKTEQVRTTSMQGQHITIPLNLRKQCGANLQGVVPNPHTPYVHTNHEIDQSQISTLTPKVLDVFLVKMASNQPLLKTR